MNVKHLDHLNLSVSDFAATADWYGRVFGFEVVEEAVDERGVHWGVLRAGDALLCVYEHPTLSLVDSDASRSQGRHALSHFGLRVEDRAAWEALLEREGIEVNYGGAVRWPHSMAWYVNDPTGWEIEVVHWDDDHVSFDPLAG